MTTDASKPAKKKRGILTNLSRTKADPNDILIAGQDFQVPEGSDLRWLQDPQSDSREAIDQGLLDYYAEHGFAGVPGTVRVVVRKGVPGYGDQEVFITDGGRRRVRAMREHNRRNNDDLRATLIVEERAVKGIAARDQSVLENHPGKPYTHRQRIELIDDYIAAGRTKEKTIALMAISASQYDAYVVLGKAELSAALIKALDDEIETPDGMVPLMSLSVAVRIAKQTKKVQGETLRALIAEARETGKPVTVMRASREIADQGGTTYKRRPGAKYVKSLIEASDALADDQPRLTERDKAIMEWASTGDLKALAKVPELQGLVDVV